MHHSGTYLYVKMMESTERNVQMINDQYVCKYHSNYMIQLRINYSKNVAWSVTISFASIYCC